MPILSIDLSGKMAHFRKYYANNTAMSYFIPPRTTIMGMIASFLGKERDSYYTALASDKIKIGIRILCPLKKSFHRVNLLKIKGSNDFRGLQGRMQIPFEVVSGLNPRKDDVKYRIFIHPVEANHPLFLELKQRLEDRQGVYNLTFGTANFTANIDQFRYYDKTEYHVQTASEEFISLHAAIRSERVKEINLGEQKKLLIEEEQIPCDFKTNFDRELSNIQRVLYSINNQALSVIIEGEYYSLLEDGQVVENITFIE